MKREKLQAEAKRFLQKWQKQLFLRGWNFELVFNEEAPPANENAMCYVSVSPEYMEATVFVNPSYYTAPNDVREHAICHELCHCHTQQLWNLAGYLLDGRLVTDRELRETTEKLTQQIAYIAMQDKWPQRRSIPRRSR